MNNMKTFCYTLYKGEDVIAKFTRLTSYFNDNINLEKAGVSYDTSIYRIVWVSLSLV